MELALRQRPAWTEVAGILAACLVLLVVLAKLDNSAARQEAARAQKVLAQQARAAAAERRRHPHVVVRPRSARTESLGSNGPIAIPVGTGVGGAWSSGTTAAVAHDKPPVAAAPSPAPRADLRRIVGPSPPIVTDAPVARNQPAPVRRAAPRPAAQAGPARHPNTNILLIAMAACGLVISAAGVAILGRSR